MKSEFDIWLDKIKSQAKKDGVDGDALINSLSLADWREWFDEGYTAYEAYKDSMRND